MYNELAILKMTQSLSLIAKNPLHVFKEEILEHLKSKSNSYITRLEAWLKLSNSENKITMDGDSNVTKDEGEVQSFSSAKYELCILELCVPEFPLLPGSKGFCISLKKALVAFREIMKEI